MWSAMSIRRLWRVGEAAEKLVGLRLLPEGLDTFDPKEAKALS